jgi:hypothetical protein
VWAEDDPTPGLAQNVPPVVVELKLGVTPVSQKQYFISPQSPGQNLKTFCQTPKIWDPLTLSVILEQTLITSPETGD